MVFHGHSLRIHFQSRAYRDGSYCSNLYMKYITVKWNDVEPLQSLLRAHNNIKEMDLLESPSIIISYSKTGWESTVLHFLRHSQMTPHSFPVTARYGMSLLVQSLIYIQPIVTEMLSTLLPCVASYFVMDQPTGAAPPVSWYIWILALPKWCFGCKSPKTSGCWWRNVILDFHVKLCWRW